MQHCTHHHCCVANSRIGLVLGLEIRLTDRLRLWLLGSPSGLVVRTRGLVFLDSAVHRRLNLNWASTNSSEATQKIQVPGAAVPGAAKPKCVAGGRCEFFDVGAEGLNDCARSLGVICFKTANGNPLKHKKPHIIPIFFLIDLKIFSKQKQYAVY
jgi:hypothetical protein